jgi:hypothetical protein
MEAQSYGPSRLKSNTPAQEPAYDPNRLKTDPAYRYGKVDEFTIYLNSIILDKCICPADKYADRVPYYTKRVCYYLDMTVAMGLPIPDFDTTLKVHVLEGVREETEDGWKPQSGGDRSRAQKPRNLIPISQPKEWEFTPRNNEEREVLCKEWFQRKRHSRFRRWGNWENKPLEERKSKFIEEGRQLNPASYSNYVKEQRKAISGDVKRFIEKYQPLTRRGPESERVQVQRLNAKRDIADELAGSPSIDWMAFTVWYELEWVAILWGMLEYKRFLKLEADTVEIISTQNNETIDTKPNEILDHEVRLFNKMPIEDTKKHFMQLTKPNSKSGKPFLTEEQVRKFIDRAFNGQEPSQKLSFSETRGSKGNIVGCFYKYYIKCVDHNGMIGKFDIMASPEKYIKLLTDNFNNWSYEEIKNNFRANGDW